jgi:hypothetical protein
MDANQNAGAPEIKQVQLGEALINPQWQGHLVAMSDNGGDMVFITIHHPRLGPINCLWSRTMAAGIAQWLDVALHAPTLTPVAPPPPPSEPEIIPDALKN